MGFAAYFTSILGYELPPIGMKFIAIAVIVASTVLNAQGAKGADKVQFFLTWGNLVILVLLIAAAVFQTDTANLRPMFPKGIQGTFSAISIIYISFFGYQLIANNTDEIKNPTKTVPLAMKYAMMVSLTLYLIISFVAVLVISWETLADSPAPLVLVAVKSFGKFGFILIAIGGILASAAALNSTLLSQGRQILCYGQEPVFA